MDRFYAPAYQHHDASRPDVLTLADYKQWARDLIAGLPDFRVEAEDLIAEGDRAVKRWTAKGHHNGTLAGIAPTGRAVQFSGVSLYRIEGERIVESWYVYDLLGLVQQIGLQLAPAPATPA
jgi:predicted ester cyclase